MAHPKQLISRSSFSFYASSFSSSHGPLNNLFFLHNNFLTFFVTVITAVPTAVASASVSLLVLVTRLEGI